MALRSSTLRQPRRQKNRKQVIVPKEEKSRHTVDAETLVEEAQTEYKAKYGAKINPDSNRVALLFEVQAAKEEADRRRRRRDALANQKTVVEEPEPIVLPCEAKMDLTAQALERVFENAQVDGIQFNPGVLLRSAHAWPIVARMAKRRDVVYIADTIRDEFLKEFIHDIVKECHQEITIQVRENVDKALQKAYPLLAPYSPDELRVRLKEAERNARKKTEIQELESGILESKQTRSHHVNAQLEGRGLVGRRLALIRRAHALVVDDFNKEHCIRVRDNIMTQ